MVIHAGCRMSAWWYRWGRFVTVCLWTFVLVMSVTGRTSLLWCAWSAFAIGSHLRPFGNDRPWPWEVTA